MRISVFAALAATFVIGTSWAQDITEKAEPVSLVLLIANPERYNNRVICVEGILHDLPRDHAVYLSASDADYCNVVNAIWIDEERSSDISPGFFESSHGQFVSVIGRFKATRKTHGPTYAGIEHYYAGTIVFSAMATYNRHYDGAIDLRLLARSLKDPSRHPLPDSLSGPPCTIKQAHSRLRYILSDSVKSAMKSSDRSIAGEYHMSLGRGLRNDWGLWQEGCLSDFVFDSLRVFHPDDMSALILESFQSSLNNRPFDLRRYLVTLESYYVPNMGPSESRCSIDHSHVQFSRLVTERGPDKSRRVWVWGTCLDNGHGWLFSKRLGWKRQDEFPLTPLYPPDLAP